MKKNTIILQLGIIIMLASNSLFSQVQPQDYTNHPRQYIDKWSFWTETVLNGKIKGKFAYQIDYQYRRMSNGRDEANGDYTNLFKLPSQQVLRPWIHYNLNPNVRFSLSPLGYWATWNAPVVVGGVEKKTFIPEFRICPQITLTQNIGRVTISQRYRYEYRIFGVTDTVPGTIQDFGYGNNYAADANHKGRMRYFIRAIIPLNHKTLEPKTFYVNAFNEVFLGLTSHTANNKLLDQNRSFVGIGYKFNPNFKIETGYLIQEVMRFNNSYYSKNNVERNNIWQIFIIIDNPKEWVKRGKEKKEPAN